MIEIIYLFIVQNFHFHPNHIFCYYAIKWSIFDLKGRFFDENTIEFNGEHVGMLCSANWISLECFQIFIPIFLDGFMPKYFAAIKAPHKGSIRMIHS